MHFSLFFYTVPHIQIKKSDQASDHESNLESDHDSDCESQHHIQKRKIREFLSWFGGDFGGRQKGLLVLITQNINKIRYIRLLRRHLFPVIQQMISFGMQEILFQQDNAPVHKAYNVMDWF